MDGTAVSGERGGESPLVGESVNTGRNAGRVYSVLGTLIPLAGLIANRRKNTTYDDWLANDIANTARYPRLPFVLGSTAASTGKILRKLAERFAHARAA